MRVRRLKGRLGRLKVLPKLGWQSPMPTPQAECCGPRELQAGPESGRRRRVVKMDDLADLIERNMPVLF